MNLLIDFNWPLNFARISVSASNIKDALHVFRIGVIHQNEKDKVYWKKPGWFFGKIEKPIIFDVERNNKIVVEQKEESGKTKRIYLWDINEKWPPKARGDILVSIPYYF